MSFLWMFSWIPSISTDFSFTRFYRLFHLRSASEAPSRVPARGGWLSWSERKCGNQGSPLSGPAACPFSEALAALSLILRASSTRSSRFEANSPGWDPSLSASVPASTPRREAASNTVMFGGSESPAEPLAED